MTSPSDTILVCDDDPMCQKALALVLGHAFNLAFTPDGDRLLELTRHLKPDAVLLDIRLRTDREGFSILPKLKALSPSLPVIIHSASQDYQSVVQAMHLGATDFIPKSTAPEKLVAHLQQALKRCRAASCAPPDCEFVGESPGAQELCATINRIRDFSGNVVITGESGVGKEIVARMLRRRRPDGTLEPFVAVDSSTIQGSTAESTLFGHERGAFTGATEKRKGLFELADGGTIYFDEIANMPLDIQAKLLRAIQEQEIVRLGSSKAIKLNFRAICASNRDLEALSRDGEFRFDLYARLSVFPLHIPPLRERSADVPLLLMHFLARHNNGVQPDIAPDALAKLMVYDWPGNVRELANTAQYILAMAGEHRITSEHLPAKITAKDLPQTPELSSDATFHAQVRAFEEAMLKREYINASGNISRMARRLGLDRSSLYRKLREYNIHTQERINNECSPA